MNMTERQPGAGLPSERLKMLIAGFSHQVIQLHERQHITNKTGKGMAVILTQMLEMLKRLEKFEDDTAEQHRKLLAEDEIQKRLLAEFVGWPPEQAMATKVKGDG